MRISKEEIQHVADLVEFFEPVQYVEIDNTRRAQAPLPGQPGEVGG